MMTKVYGTGVFDFKHPRLAEYPVEELPQQPPSPGVSDSPPESKLVASLSTSITLAEIQRDRLAKIAAENWAKTGDCAAMKKPFSFELVGEIYTNELTVKGGQKPVPLLRVMILEVSQYLENYLWPNFHPETATFEHVMSMILMVNEKFRENVAAWMCFHDRNDMFQAFLQRVLCLKEERNFSISEKTNYLLFMINSFQSVEDRIMRQNVLVIAGMRCWHSLSYGRLQVLDSSVFHHKPLDDESGQPVNIGDLEQVKDACVLYCERFMEFPIDLLSQLPTRRYTKHLVADIAVVSKCHLSALYGHEKGKLFSQLVDLLQFYERFAIDEYSGKQMFDDDVLQARYKRFQAFQLLAFMEIPKLRELALANIGAIEKRVDLSKRLEILSPEELRDLVCTKLELLSKDDPWSERVDFLIEVMIGRVHTNSTLEAVFATSLVLLNSRAKSAVGPDFLLLHRTFGLGQDPNERDRIGRNQINWRPGLCNVESRLGPFHPLLRSIYSYSFLRFLRNPVPRPLGRIKKFVLPVLLSYQVGAREAYAQFYSPVDHITVDRPLSRIRINDFNLVSHNSSECEMLLVNSHTREV